MASPATDLVPVPPVTGALARLARALGTTARTLIEHVEPWLFARGFVRTTPGGRTAAPRARIVGGAPVAPNVRRDTPWAYRTP